MGRPPGRPERYRLVRPLQRRPQPAPPSPSSAGGILPVPPVLWIAPNRYLLSGSSLGHDDGAGEPAVVGEGEVKMRDAELTGAGRDGPRDLDPRPAGLLAHDVGVGPVQPARRAQRLRQRL